MPDGKAAGAARDGGGRGGLAFVLKTWRTMRETKNLKTQLFVSSFTLQCVADPRAEKDLCHSAEYTPLRSPDLLFSYIALLPAQAAPFFMQVFLRVASALFYHCLVGCA